MFKISVSLVLFVILSNSLIIAMGKTLSDFENEIGAIYPKEFKNYISQFKGCDLVSFKIMHDSFQLVTEDNVDIFNDQVFTPIELVNDLNAYIRKELQNPSLIALPIARSLTGDKYGFLFLVSGGGFRDPMELFHRDTDRLYFKTVPIGSLFNYVKPNTQFNPVVMEITQEASSLTSSKEGTVVDYMQLYSSELSEEMTKIPEGTFTVEISFHLKDDFTLVSIHHFVKQNEKTYCYKTTFKDTEVKYHQYSYEHGAYWNYFSLLQYCMLQSIVAFQSNKEFSIINFTDYWKHFSLSELVRLGLSKN
jgi:hypothetical protein